MDDALAALLLPPIDGALDELLVSSRPAHNTPCALDPRVRRTEIERLSRRRRQASLKTKRDELQHLEAQHAALLAAHAHQRYGDKRRARPSARLPIVLGEDDVGIVVRGDALAVRERFVALSLEIERLEAVQKDLQTTLRAKHLLTLSLQSLATVCTDQWQDVVPMPMTDLDYTPLRVDEYVRIMRDAYTELLAFEALLVRDDEHKTCMGWQHRQQPEARHVLSSLSKIFRGREAESLMRETWALLSSEQRLRQAFGDWSDGIRCRVLYELSEDAVVLYRTFERRHVAKRFHSIVLLYRVQTDDGYAIGTRTIPTPAVQDALTLPDKWITICEWVLFKCVAATVESQDTAACESGVEVVFGAAHPTPLPVPLAQLSMNFFTTVLRWQGSIATPMALTWA